MLENLKPIKREYPCRIQTELQKLDSKDAKILQEALEDEDAWSANSLSTQLKQVAGIIMSDGAIYRHRKLLCSCGTK